MRILITSDAGATLADVRIPESGDVVSDRVTTARAAQYIGESLRPIVFCSQCPDPNYPDWDHHPNGQRVHTVTTRPISFCALCPISTAPDPASHPDGGLWHRPAGTVYRSNIEDDAKSVLTYALTPIADKTAIMIKGDENAEVERQD